MSMGKESMSHWTDSILPGPTSNISQMCGIIHGSKSLVFLVGLRRMARFGMGGM